MPCYGQKFHIYREIGIPRLNDSVQHLNLSFHLDLEKLDIRALNTFAEYDHNNVIKRKLPSNDLRLNTLL